MRRLLEMGGAVPAALLIGLLLATTACSERRPNVIVIVVDTLRADHVGAYGYDREVTPHLDRRAGEGALFENALAPSSWTLPSFGSLFTGQIPSRHAAGMSPGEPKNPFTKLDRSVRTLAEVLSENGYATAAVVNNAWLGPAFDMSRGFDSWDFAPSGERLGRRADEVVGRALVWLEEHPAQEPFLLVVHLFDPHMSYDPPETTRGRFTAERGGALELPVTRTWLVREEVDKLSPADREFITAAYDEEIAFVDEQLERFFSELESRDLLDRSIVLLTADHGEELFDHGGFEHGHSMYQELLRVPLIAWSPEIRPGRHDQAVSLIDLFPTILDGAGLATPDGLAGSSLWPLLTGSGELEPRALISEGTLYEAEKKAVVRWPMKLVVEFPELELQLYDLTSDGDERRELAGEEPELAGRMLEELRDAVISAGDLRSPDEPATVDEDVREKLRSLGYVQ